MFDLQAYFDERCQCIDRELDAAMPAEDVPPHVLHEAMRYCVFSGGKRLRPMLCLAAAESVGADPASAMLPALAVELLHTYTLIHDDLPCMDDDDMRRGKPTCHVAFGQANAVLAGDALQALAFELAARAPIPEGTRPAALVLELARAAGSRGVVGGQVEDLALLEGTPTRESVDFVHEHKTAALFRVAVRMGALAGGASQAALAALSTYGSRLGVAFQIADDLLDKPGQPQEAADAQLSPYLAVYGIEQAGHTARQLIDESLQALAGLRAEGTDAMTAIARFVISRKH